MTLVNINLKNVGSGTNPVDKVIFYSPVYRDGADSSELISTAEYAVSLVNGVGSINLAPGPVRVRFSVKGIADTVAKEGIVPNSGTVSLNKVIEGSFTYTPAITNEALKKITTAKNNALGEVAGAVESEVDKIIAIGEEFPKVKANADRAEQMSILSMASMAAIYQGDSVSETLIPGIKSVSLELSSGTGSLFIPLPQRQPGLASNNQRIYLDPGVYSIMAVTDAERALTVRAHRDIVNANSTWTDILTIPTGANGQVRQATTMLSVNKRSALLFVLNASPSTEMLNVGYSPGITIINMGTPA